MFEWIFGNLVYVIGGLILVSIGVMLFLARWPRTFARPEYSEEAVESEVFEEDYSEAAAETADSTEEYPAKAAERMESEKVYPEKADKSEVSEEDYSEESAKKADYADEYPEEAADSMESEELYLDMADESEVSEEKYSDVTVKTAVPGKKYSKEVDESVSSLTDKVGSLLFLRNVLLPNPLLYLIFGRTSPISIHILLILQKHLVGKILSVENPVCLFREVQF